MNVYVAAPAAALLVLLFGTKTACGQLKVGESSCNSTTFFSVRSVWASDDEPCHQKLSLDMWAFMKGQGSDQDADAQHVYMECLRQPEMGLVELIIPKNDGTSNIVGAPPGQIVSESKNAASIVFKGAEDFEAICKDETITKATRVVPNLASKPASPRTSRRLQTTTSEAVVAHQVGELIQGLTDLGCLRTTGEDQTICVMSDSFNRLNGAAGLQQSGDLPAVEVVKELTEEQDGSDEGSAMIELAFDIASGATYKFNTAFMGEMAFAEDIAVLADAEECDVIVDDVGYPQTPGFRDGALADAVDAAAQDHDVLYFSSAGNSGQGHRFTSNWECQVDLFDCPALAPCTTGVSAHVFFPDETGLERYLFPFTSTSERDIIIKWDDDEGSAREVTIAIWEETVPDEIGIWGQATSIAGSATAFIAAPGDGQQYYITLHLVSGDSLENVDMHLVSFGNDLVGTPASSGSMFGQACATNAISVASMSHFSASGDGGAFADPETASVQADSSRGPCLVDDGLGVMTRNHPVTTAADELKTSTSPEFDPFFGTSAAAPVVAAIATIIRAACFPRVVTFSDMMEMLTNYEYTIDVTSDAGGALETFGPEAGYGIISAQQMCRWVADNCGETCPGSAAMIHGDPHLVGLGGQKFDFTGKSNSWYALLSGWGTEHVNMRVTAPINDLPGVTYITGISVQAEDEDGVGHSIVILVNDPTVLDTSCPQGGEPCLGDGALTVLLDGVSVASPGQKHLGPGVSFVAANIPGECRPFGFERYWQQKVREAELRATQQRRRLSAAPDIYRWIADDASATNPPECKEYVSKAMKQDSIFTHQSDHVSFQLITPNLTLRLNHGKLHQMPVRDPTNTFDIPDHTTFQMNLGFLGIQQDATMQGIIGETSVPTIDEHGAKIMSGLEAIRGQEEDYKVDGALGKTFKQLITGV